MKKRVATVLAVLAFAVLPILGCSIVTPVHGGLFTETQGPVAYGDDGRITKTGKACVKGIFGIATGDASIQAAMKEGGIRNVVMVDTESTSYFGLYVEYCTIVRGS